MLWRKDIIRRSILYALGIAAIIVTGTSCAAPTIDEGQTLPTLIPTTDFEEAYDPESEVPPTFTPKSPSTQAIAVTEPEPSATSSLDNAPTLVPATPVPQPTHTEVPTIATLPTSTPQPAALPTALISFVRFDYWLFEVNEVRIDPGMDSTRQSLVLLGYVTNEGTQTETTLLSRYEFKLQDDSGQIYEPDQLATFAAEDKYGTQDTTSMSPGTRRYAAVAFDIPVSPSPRTFSLVPGDLTASWSGNVTFSIAGGPAAQNNPPPSESGLGSLRFDHWLLEITNIHSDPGMEAGWQMVVILGTLTNEGNQTATIVFTDTSLKFRDSSGRVYEPELRATFAAEDKYGTESTSSINPGASRFVAVAFSAPSSEQTFTIIPGTLIASWSGDVTFTIP